MFCMKCGKKIDDDSKFCPYCGGSTSGDMNTPSVGSNIVVTSKRSNKNVIIGVSACFLAVLAIIGVVKIFSGGFDKEVAEQEIGKPIVEAEDTVAEADAENVAKNSEDEVAKAFSGGTVKEELECGLKYEIPKGASEIASVNTWKTYEFSNSNDYKDFQLYVWVYETEYLEDESPRDIPTDTLKWSYQHLTQATQADCEFNHTTPNGKESWYQIIIKVFSSEDSEADMKARLEFAHKVTDSVDISDLRYGE